MIKNGFDSELVHNNKYIKTKIKIYNNKTNTNFYGNKIPKENESCIYSSGILLDSVVKVDRDDYPQIFFKECKYAIKKENNVNSIDKELNLDESDDESDNYNSNEYNGVENCILNGFFIFMDLIVND